MVAKYRPSAMRFSKAVVRRASIIDRQRRQPAAGPRGAREVRTDGRRRRRKSKKCTTSNIGPLSTMRFSKVVVRRASIDLSRERRQPVSRSARSEGGADGGGQEIDFDRDLKGSARHQIVGRWGNDRRMSLRDRSCKLVHLRDTPCGAASRAKRGS